jgi:MFS family permease
MTDETTRWGVSRNTWVLGWVSLLTDIATEIVYPLLPLYLTGVLGADKSLVGLIEGIAESTASLMKFVSGWLADRTGRFKLLVGLGYGLSAVGRPFLALAAAPWQVLILRLTDRLGKGIRTAPRDSLIAASSSLDQLGRAFGLHRTMDQCGAVIGPAIAVALMAAFHDQYALVFALASIPGFVAVGLIVARVRDATGPALGRPPHLLWRAFDARFKLFALSAGVFALANSSNAFLILRVQDLGVPTSWVPLAYMLYNLVTVLVAMPAGIVSDRIGRPAVMAVGYVAFALAYAGFGAASAPWQAWALLAGYGLFAGLTDGAQRAWIAELAPEDLRGSAFGVYHFIVGLAALPASLLTGWLWDHGGAPVAFYVDAGLAVLALAVFGASLRVKGRAHA